MGQSGLTCNLGVDSNWPGWGSWVRSGLGRMSGPRYLTLPPTGPVKVQTKVYVRPIRMCV